MPAASLSIGRHFGKVSRWGAAGWESSEKVVSFIFETMLFHISIVSWWKFIRFAWVKHPFFLLVPTSSQFTSFFCLQGKSTVLQMIAGKLKPTSGHVFYSTSPPSLAGPKKQQKQTVVPQNIGKESRCSTNAARWRTHPASFQKASSGISFLEFLMMICPWYLGKHLMKHCTNSLNSCEPCESLEE